MLYAYLHGSKRVLDLVGNLAGHLAPGFFPFVLCKLPGTAVQVVDHLVVGTYQQSQLVVGLVVDVLGLVGDIHLKHVAVDLLQRPGYGVGNGHAYQDRGYDEEYVEVDYGGHDGRGVIFEIGLGYEVRDVGYGYQPAVAVVYGGVQGIVAERGYVLFLHDLGPLVDGQLVERLGVHPGAEEIFVEHFRLGGVDEPAFRVVDVDVHLGTSGDVVDDAENLGRAELAVGVGILGYLCKRVLYGQHFLLHHGAVVGVHVADDDDDAADGHHDQGDHRECRDEYGHLHAE